MSLHKTRPSRETRASNNVQSLEDEKANAALSQVVSLYLHSVAERRNQTIRSG